MSAQAWLVLAPIVLAWIAVLSDIALQPRMPGTMKALWAVASTVFWPMLVVYLLTRPMQGRAERPAGARDPRSRLVAAVLAHEDGRITDQQFDQVAQVLRRGQME